MLHTPSLSAVTVSTRRTKTVATHACSADDELCENREASTRKNQARYAPVSPACTCASSTLSRRLKRRASSCQGADWRQTTRNRPEKRAWERVGELRCSSGTSFAECSAFLYAPRFPYGPFLLIAHWTSACLSEEKPDRMEVSANLHCLILEGFPRAGKSAAHLSGGRLLLARRPGSDEGSTGSPP
jgi:hypothetical protein